MTKHENSLNGMTGICAVEFQSAIHRTEGHLCSRQTIVDSHQRNLPHWGCENGLVHVTFRLADSMPESLLVRYRDEKEEWLRDHVGQLTTDDLVEYEDLFVNRIDSWLDQGYGACVLACPECRQIVESAIEYFNAPTIGERTVCGVERASRPFKDKEDENSLFLNGRDARSTGADACSTQLDGRATARYRLHSYVVMPNHVHVLMELFRRDGLAGIVQSWKSFTAKRINAIVGSSGRLWQQEYFDRLIRNGDHYEKTLAYIRKNAGGHVCVK